MMPVRASLREMQPFLLSNTMSWTLGGLLAFDSVLLLMHVAYVYSDYYGLPLRDSLEVFSMETDGGYSEWFEYAVNAVSIGMLWSCWLRARQPIFAALPFVLAFVLADNAFQLHETVGRTSTTGLQPLAVALSLEAHVLGELLFHVVTGTVLCGLVIMALLRTERSSRVIGVAFLVLLLLLGGFGTGVDLVHSALIDSSGERNLRMIGGPVDRILGFVEDAGEMIILSVICALSCAVRVQWAEQEGLPPDARARG